MLYEFGLKIENAPGIFHRSKLLVLKPHFMLRNETPYLIAVAQYGC